MSPASGSPTPRTATTGHRQGRSRGLGRLLHRALPWGAGPDAALCSVERKQLEETQDIAAVIATMLYRAALNAMNNMSTAAESLTRLQKQVGEVTDMPPSIIASASAMYPISYARAFKMTPHAHRPAHIEFAQPKGVIGRARKGCTACRVPVAPLPSAPSTSGEQRVASQGVPRARPPPPLPA